MAHPRMRVAVHRRSCAPLAAQAVRCVAFLVALSPVAAMDLHAVERALDRQQQLLVHVRGTVDEQLRQQRWMAHT